MVSQPRVTLELQATCSVTRARAGVLHSRRGEVLTPAFMPVGTQATVRGQTADWLAESGSRILLANTYHLMLRPGPETLEALGGIHRFMRWDGLVLTDSGGFQVFSLDHQVSVDDEGATFRPHPDAAPVRLTPERSLSVQRSIGSDIAMAFDQCVPSTCDHATALRAMDRTHRWAERSLATRTEESSQSIFGIVQGACFEDLRRASARAITSLPFDGFAIGGLAVGETRAQREDFTALTAELLPTDKPRYLMGVGTPIDLLEAVSRGVDLFDCILPTALAQQGTAYTSRGRVQLRRGTYKLSKEPLDPECTCDTCTRYSRAYLHHLVAAREVLGWSLIGRHNIHFYHELMRRIRSAIVEGRFAAFYREERERLVLEDPENPIRPPRAKKRKQPQRELGRFELAELASGGWSVRDRDSGEVMHSVIEPSEEARRLYVEQSRLRERLSQPADPGIELIVWDVGMGMAANAMATLREAESLVREGKLVRPLRMVSFERDLDALRLALAHAPGFPHLHHGAPQALLRDGAWSGAGGKLRWELREGDFLEQAPHAPVPALVFYDPFSPKVDSPLWALDCFEKLRGIFGQAAVELFTYSNSTAVRATLLASGFFVAQGVGTGPKADSTLALTDPERSAFASRLLGRDWLARWERSTARLPLGVSEPERERAEGRVRGHRQFAILSSI